MCTARLLLQGVDVFALKFYLDRVVPINHSWHQKTRPGLPPDGEDRMPLRSLVLTQDRSVMDGRTDGYAVAYTALAKLSLRRAVKKVSFQWKNQNFLRRGTPHPHIHPSTPSTSCPSSEMKSCQYML